MVAGVAVCVVVDDAADVVCCITVISGEVGTGDVVGGAGAVACGVRICVVGIAGIVIASTSA